MQYVSLSPGKKALMFGSEKEGSAKASEILLAQ
jgi:hypothetical protein